MHSDASTDARWLRHLLSSPCVVNPSAADACVGQSQAAANPIAAIRFMLHPEKYLADSLAMADLVRQDDTGAAPSFTSPLRKSSR